MQISQLIADCVATYSPINKTFDNFSGLLKSSHAIRALEENQDHIYIGKPSSELTLYKEKDNRPASTSSET